MPWSPFRVGTPGDLAPVYARQRGACHRHRRPRRRKRRIHSADNEYAARKASQEALARALRADDDPSPGDELTTKDYLAALAATRATVSEDTVEEFLQDITTIARL